LDDFNVKARRIVELRDQADRFSLDAEDIFAAAFGKPAPLDFGESGFSVRASMTLIGNRRRFDAWHHSPAIASLDRLLARGAKVMTSLGDLGFEIWLPNRFRRIVAPDGVEFLDSADLFEINPDTSRRIADIDFGDPHKGRVKRGWVLMARSGQIYGINGSAVMAAEEHEKRVVSDDVIRIAPKSAAVLASGYVFVALTHPTLGRPRVKALAYGSSIPHIEPTDLSRLRIPRLDSFKEKEIAKLAEKASVMRSDADVLERQIGEQADAILSSFLTVSDSRAAGLKAP
jgi:hypothetical protein